MLNYNIIKTIQFYNIIKILIKYCNIIKKSILVTILLRDQYH